MLARHGHLRGFLQFLQRLVAAGGVALVLLLSVLAASPEAHAWLHHEAGHADHECAVTLFQQGVAPVSGGAVLAPVALILLAWVGKVPGTLYLALPPYWLPPGHAPPVG